MLDPSPYAGPLVVTLIYLALYYAFQLRIMRVKSALRQQYEARGERFDRYFGQDREMLAADRAQLNMLEHMPPFLALLWLHAAFVSPGSATLAGVIYVAARIAHPVVMGSKLGRGVRLTILFATLPGYLVLTYLMVGLALRLAGLA